MSLLTMPAIVSVGVTTAVVALATAATQPSVPSLHRLAPRVEAARYLPEETRQTLRSVIQRVKQDAKDGRVDQRNAALAVRIERAMQTKPVSATR